MGLLQLSDEMILKIVDYCTTESVISLSETCQKLDNLLQDKLFCDKLIYSWSLRIQRNRFVKFLENSNRALVISSLNITDLYWIPSGILRSVLVRMTNLKELLAAGTQLSWGHLHQTIIQHLPNLEKLSWSWDNRLEMYHRNAGQRGAPVDDQENYGKLKTILKDQLLRLRCLLIHIPLLTNCPEAVICSHAALTYLISLCTNLEQLYIMGWPRDETEDSLTANFNKEIFDNDMNFPKLHTVVFSAVERPRISTVRLYNYFITNFKKNKIAPKKLWIEHPLLSLSRKHKVTHGEFTSWNELDFSQVESYSFPLLEEAVLPPPPCDMNQKNYLRKCRELQVVEGLPRKLSITNLFDESSNLETYCCKSFNHRMDWIKFAKLHPKLRSVNICYDKEICNTDFCVALATLYELRHLAVPLESLIEIRDPTLLSEYNLSLTNEKVELNCPSTSTETDTIRDASNGDYLNLFGKRRRVGVPSSSATTRVTTTGVSGLDLIAKSCRHIQEFEIGFNKNDSSVGKILVDSLFSISKWKNLAKLTLDKLPIQNAKFLIEIGKSCKQLESLRLNHLGNRGKCVYNSDLCTALTFCHNLRDFRFEQNYYGNTRPLLAALEKCQKLRRVLIYTVPNDVSLEESAVVCLFSKCQELVMFHIIQGSTPKYVCDNLRKHLERTFKPSRPNLSLFVKNAHEDFEVPIHPSVHYRQTVCYISQVCQFVDIPKFS